MSLRLHWSLEGLLTDPSLSLPLVSFSIPVTQCCSWLLPSWEVALSWH